MISKRLLELAVVSTVEGPLSSKSPVAGGCDGYASMSRRLISLTGSGYSSFFFSFSFSSSLLSSFLAEMPENNADFIFSFFSSTTGFSGSFFFVDDIWVLVT